MSGDANDPAGGPASGDDGAPSGADPVGEILAAWQERRNRGEALTIDDIVREHPELELALRERVAAIELLKGELADADAPAPHGLAPLRVQRYTNFRPAGQGGMGIVYWALDTDLNREVAFKVVRPDTGRGSDASVPPVPGQITPPGKGTPASAAFETLCTRFLQEAWVTAGLEHPGIVPVYELGETPEHVPYYTMRFVRGSRTLAHAIAQARSQPIEARLALLEPFLKICDTLRYAHARGVIHRDLKPENVALGEFGEVVVLDWGLAKLAGTADRMGEAWQAKVRELRDASDLRTLASALGTPGYMSPEAALGRADEVDQRSDVYSLGAILYQTLTGRLPFQFDSYGDLMRQLMAGTPPEPSSLDPSVPQAISNLCVRALAKNRDARPPSVGAFAEEIRAWQRQLAVDREADGLLREAGARLEAARSVSGDDRLAQLDRAAGVLSRLAEVRAGDAGAAAIADEVEALRRRGALERERATRGRTVRRAAVVGLAAALVAAVVVAYVVQGQQRETEEALGVARDERDAKQRALSSAQRERDAKTAALADAQAERDAKGAALADAQRERDAKSAALDDAQRERDAKAAALGTAQRERDAKAQALTRSAATTLAAQSLVALKTDPGLALALAMESARRHPSPQANAALVESMVAEPEDRLFEDPGSEQGLRGAFFAAGGRELLLSGSGGLRVADLETGRTIRPLALPRFDSAVVSPDGLRMVPVDRMGLLVEGLVLDTATFERRVTLLTPADLGFVLPAFSGDGQRIVAAGIPRAVLTAREDPGSVPVTVLFWNAVTGAETGRASLVVAPRELRSSMSLGLTVDRTGSECVLAGRRIRPGEDVHAVAAPATAPGLVRHVLARTYTPEGLRLVHVVGSDTGRWTIQVADAAGGVVREFDAGPVPAVLGVVTPDGARLITARYDEVCEVWDLATGRSLASCRTARAGPGHEAPPPFAQLIEGLGGEMRIRMSPDGERFMPPLGGEPRALVFSTTNGRLLATLTGHKSAVLGATFAAGGRAVATWAGDGTVRVWRMRPSPPVRLDGPSTEAVAFCAGGSRVVASGRDDICRVHDAATGEVTASFRPRAQWAVSSLACSPDGRYVVTGSNPARDAPAAERSVQVWDAATGAAVAEWGGLPDRVWAVEFSRDGKHLAAVARGSVRVWDFPSGARPRDLATGTTWVHSTSFSPDGTRIATADGAEDAAVWDVATAKRVLELKSAIGKPNCLAWSGDGRRIAACNSGQSVGKVAVWDAATGALLRTLETRKSPDGIECEMWSVAFDPAGGRIAAAGFDGVARIWDAETGAELHRLEPGTGMLYLARFSPDGRQLLTAAEDGSAQLWDVATGAEVVRFGRRESEWVTGARMLYWPTSMASFSPDGTTVVTCSADGPATIWPTDPLAAAAARRPRPLTAAERERFTEPLESDAAVRRRAKALVDGLFEDLRVVADVVAHLESDRSAGDDVREAALRIARERTDDATKLNQWAWDRVRLPDFDDALVAACTKVLGPMPQAADIPRVPAETRRRALRCAEVAAALAPDDGAILNTLGVAQVRAGEFAAAVGTLRRSDRLNAGREASDIACLAIALARLGRTDEAGTELARLEKLVAAMPKGPSESLVFLVEARVACGAAAATAAPGTPEKSEK